jgi:hypothetical protein
MSSTITQKYITGTTVRTIAPNIVVLDSSKGIEVSDIISFAGSANGVIKTAVTYYVWSVDELNNYLVLSTNNAATGIVNFSSTSTSTAVSFSVDGARVVTEIETGGSSTTNITNSIAIDYTSYYKRIAHSLETIATNSTSIASNIQTITSNTTQIASALAMISTDTRTISTLATGSGITTVSPWDWLSLSSLIYYYQSNGIDPYELKRIVESYPKN